MSETMEADRTRNKQKQMRKRISENEVLQDISEVAKYLNNSPNLKEYKQFGKYGLTVIYKRFGNFETALSKVGLKPKKVGTKRISDQDLRNDLIKVAKELGKQPTQREYTKLGKYTRHPFKRFGSWKNAFINFGLIYKVHNSHKRQYTDSDVTRDLEYVKSKIGNFPTNLEYKKYGKISTKTLYNYADTNKWGLVLIKFLKLDENKVDFYSSKKKEDYKNKSELLEEIRNLAKYLRHSPTRKESQKYNINFNIISSRFKVYKWNEILKLAGLPPAEKRNANKR